MNIQSPDMIAASNYMSYRGLVTNGSEQRPDMKSQVYATMSDESVAADSGVFEAHHKEICRTYSGNSVGSLWLDLFSSFYHWSTICLVIQIHNDVSHYAVLV